MGWAEWEIYRLLKMEMTEPPSYDLHLFLFFYSVSITCCLYLRIFISVMECNNQKKFFFSLLRIREHQYTKCHLIRDFANDILQILKMY